MLLCSIQIMHCFLAQGYIVMKSSRVSYIRPALKLGLAYCQAELTGEEKHNSVCMLAVAKPHSLLKSLICSLISALSFSVKKKEYESLIEMRNL